MRTHRIATESGFTLIELVISVAVLMIVSGIVIEGMLGLGRISDIVANRTEMHAAVRNATELLQQEVGQAGRISLPGDVTLTAGVTAVDTTATVSSTAGMFVGQHLLVGVGEAEETVLVQAVNSATQISLAAAFLNAHPAATPVWSPGAFASGIVPTTAVDGSTDDVLKIVGDIDGNGNMVYVEYVCDTEGGRLYRNSIPYDAPTKPAPTIEQVLLHNVLPNPDGTPCFTYQERDVNGATYVIGVAITLTVETNDPDPITGEFQTETKALLNVSPRNVFNAWQLASLGYVNRIQPLPPQTLLLLPTLEPEEEE